MVREALWSGVLGVHGTGRGQALPETLLPVLGAGPHRALPSEAISLTLVFPP